MEIRFCPECGERLQSSVYEGRAVYLCYDCEYIVPVLTPRVPSAIVPRRVRKTDVSRSAVLLAF